MTAVMERVGVTKSRVKQRVVLGGTALCLLSATVVFGLYVTVPTGGQGDGPVDALVVLGTPAGLHGEMNPMQIWRVDEAMREFWKGRAPRVLFTGGPTANRFVEADVMATYARGLGLPEGAILEERRSHTTLQNIAGAAQILRAHGWNSVEVVSSPQHLPRAAVLLDRSGLQWRVHAAPTPGWSSTQIAIAYIEEAIGTAVLRVFGNRAEPVLHLLSEAQQRAGWAMRWVTYRVQGWRAK